MLYSLAHPVSPTSRYDCEDGEDVLPDVSAFLYRPTAVHSILTGSQYPTSQYDREDGEDVTVT